ncbi:MAG: RsfS/YbeB/iojap family protein, partial [Candidatus Eremiobacteraeota bacterium]|nr:RsfS/YbeB/iojap family protein [Candidatus Eremiobacteraeota bacterium]
MEIDIAGKTILADTFVIATGRSKIQTRSIAENISQKIKEAGGRVMR